MVCYIVFYTCFYAHLLTCLKSYRSSIHTATFFVVYLMIFSHFVYIVRAVVLDFKNSGLMAALFHGPWLAANISSVICLASIFPPYLFIFENKIIQIRHRHLWL